MNVTRGGGGSSRHWINLADGKSLRRPDAGNGPAGGEHDHNNTPCKVHAGARTELSGSFGALK